MPGILHHLLDKQIQQNPDFFFPVLCCNSDFTQFLYSSDQMPVRTVFPGLYTLLGFKIMVRWSPQKCKIRGLL